MAKKLVDWNLDGSVLTLTHRDIMKSQAFELTDLMVNVVWDDLDDCEKQTIANGVKQKLADSYAASKDMTLTGQERYDRVAALWDQLTVERTWSKKSGERLTPQKKLDAALEDGLKLTEEQKEILAKIGLKL